MRKVFDNDMVAHVWAQQSQAEGRSSNGQFYFDGATIYSYGRHFPIARICRAENGAPFVLFTTRDYSMTTGRHKSMARSACRHFSTFFVRDPSSDNVHGMYRDAVKAEMDKAAAEEARHTRNWQKRALAALTGARYIAEEANRYAALTGDEWRLALPEVSNEALTAYAAEVAAKAKAAAEREALAQAEHRAAWFAGVEYIPGLKRFDAECGGAALRIVGEELQTSHGATVPLAHAIKAFRFLKLVRERGEGWHHNGHSIRVGHFTVDSIAPNGDFKAGCHDIRWPEVERVAKLAGVFDATADDAALSLTYSAA